VPYWGEFSPSPGTGNISKDPMFIDAANKDYRLDSLLSQCVNRADDGYNMGAYLGLWKQPEEPESVSQNLLCQNIPNPFNNNTRIEYQIFSRKATENVSLRVYNTRGQLVRTLVSEPKTNGQYIAYWNGRSEAGIGVSSGVYFCRLQVGRSYSKAIKMIWLRPHVEEQPGN